MATHPFPTPGLSLPPEIFLNIIEHCNLSSIANLLAANKATFTLITNYQNQIATAVASRDEERLEGCGSYQTCFAHIGTSSEKGLVILRELRSRRTRQACLRMLGAMET